MYHLIINPLSGDNNLRTWKTLKNRPEAPPNFVPRALGTNIGIGSKRSHKIGIKIVINEKRKGSAQKKQTTTLWTYKYAWIATVRPPYWAIKLTDSRVVFIPFISTLFAANWITLWRVFTSMASTTTTGIEMCLSFDFIRFLFDTFTFKVCT